MPRRIDSRLSRGVDVGGRHLVDDGRDVDGGRLINSGGLVDDRRVVDSERVVDSGGLVDGGRRGILSLTSTWARPR
jgi:hypothetical protein